jgi:hypothetical protein
VEFRAASRHEIPRFDVVKTKMLTKLQKYCSSNPWSNMNKRKAMWAFLIFPSVGSLILALGFIVNWYLAFLVFPWAFIVQMQLSKEGKETGKYLKREPSNLGK